MRECRGAVVSFCTGARAGAAYETPLGALATAPPPVDMHHPALSLSMSLLTLVAAAMLSAAPPRDGGAAIHNAVITAPHFGGDHKQHRATYDGGVKVVRDTLTLTCDSLDAFTNDADQVVRILARGHVIAIDGDREAHSETADYDYLTEVLVARGNPWGRQGKR